MLRRDDGSRRRPSPGRCEAEDGFEGCRMSKARTSFLMFAFWVLYNKERGVRGLVREYGRALQRGGACTLVG